MTGANKGIELADFNTENNNSLPPERKVFGVKLTVFFLGLTSLFADISSEMVYPYLVIFLSSVLHVSTIPIGFIEGLAESTASISKVFSGWLSDRIGRRKGLTALGYSVGIFSRPLLALTQTWPQVAFLRFFDRLGKGTRTSPRDALIADTTPEPQRGRAFGVHRTLDTIGAILGPAAALLVFFIMGQKDIRALFVIAGIPALIATLLLIFFVREARHKAPAAERPKITLSIFNRRFRFFVLIVTVFALGNSSDVFLILRAKNLGVSSNYIIGALYLSFNVTYALFATPAGIISDRIGRRAVIVIGYLGFAVVYLGFAFAPSYYYLWPLFVLYGTYPALTDAVQRAFAADLAPEELRATGLGVFHFFVGLAAFPASFIGGLLWQYISPEATFLYGVAGALLAVVLFVGVFPRVARRETAQISS